MSLSKVLLGCIFSLGLGWTTGAFAQLETTIAEGERLAAAGDVEGALKVYEQLAGSHPDSHQVYAHLGGMQLANRHYADAVKSFQQAVSLGDTGAGAFIGMGMGYLHMGLMGPARAAFVEAKSRGVKNAADVDGIISWIDSREAGISSTRQ